MPPDKVTLLVELVLVGVLAQFAPFIVRDVVILVSLSLKELVFGGLALA